MDLLISQALGLIVLLLSYHKDGFGIKNPGKLYAIKQID